MNDEDIFTIHAEGFSRAMELLYESIFENYGEHDRLVPLEELSQLFKTKFVNDKNDCVFTADQMQKFIEQINQIVIDRTLESLVKKGYVDMYHDGNDFAFKMTDSGKKALDKYKE